MKRLVLVIFSCLLSQHVFAQSNWIKTNLPLTAITSVETTPYGVLAGEHNSNTWLNPPPENALYLSEDLGESWKIIGLNKKGVVDIKYFGGSIYAATYYSTNNDNGLFISSDLGKNWIHLGPSYSPVKVDVDAQTIYIATEVCGLWISTNQGQTWSQKIGSGCDGTKATNVKSFEKIAFTSTLSKVYKSLDHGVTWNEITFLSGKSISFFNSSGNISFAGSSGNLGLYISLDNGVTWRKLESFGNYSVGNITYYKDRFYVGRENSQEANYSVYYTEDLGKTWVDTHLDSKNSFDKTLKFTPVYSEPSYLFTAVLKEGVFKYPIPPSQELTFPFLNLPWSSSAPNVMLDTITSYFDHSYPLLGYLYFSEPLNELFTTLNFYGVNDKEPALYYSSHSGIDFGIDYGTEIRAPASGYATYFYCDACGNTIKINHLNGYETIYEHLQSKDLATSGSEVWLNINDRIGKVGLSGNTTGPHLHFEVIKDVNSNGSFLDDFPMGRVDPFGWQSLKIADPWKTYFWEDTLGEHFGAESIYLWKSNIGKSSSFLTATSIPHTEVVLDNKKLSFTNLTKSITAKITSYIRPTLPNAQSNLKYIENTSFIVEAYDQMENAVTSFDNALSFSISINPDSLSNILISSLKLYFWNETTALWEPLLSFFDESTNILTAQSNHLSRFAVFGEKIDSSPPQTYITVLGDGTNGWFSNFPTIDLNPTDPENSQIKFTIYSINSGKDWENYLQPFTLEKDGVTNFMFRSQDVNGNLEDTKSYVIQVNVSGKQTNNIKVVNASFDVQ